MRLSHDDAYQLAREEDQIDRREQRQRTARRAKVNEFLASKKYWHLMRFLTEHSVSLGFLSIEEALCVWRFHLHAGTRINWTRDDVRMRYVVARFFNRLGKDWLC